MTESRPSLLARLFRSAAVIEPQELKAVVLSMLYFFFLFGSYSVLKPVRDAMGTVYGIERIQELFTGTLIASFIFAPLYSFFASRLRLAVFLPWVYGFVAATILALYVLFQSVQQHQERWVAATFYIWISTFNILIISVFWTFMADIFSREQAKRLFGFVAAGGTVGGIVGPLVVSTLAKSIGNDNLMLISAAGFGLTAVLVVLLTREKQRLLASGTAEQRTSLDHRLKGGNPFDGFKLLLQSRYLLLLAAFLLLMTWISTIVYIQLGDLITKAFSSREARAQAYANIDLAVNSLAVVMQLFGTGRFIKKFGVTTGLLVNPVIMVVAFLAVLLSPVLMVLGGIQILRRVAEYAVAKPTREMLFTVVDQDAKYKAKNVIDTVVYRFGDWSASWVSSVILPFGVTGLAIFGAIIAAIWFPVALRLGRSYEDRRATGA